MKISCRTSSPVFFYNRQGGISSVQGFMEEAIENRRGKFD